MVDAIKFPYVDVRNEYKQIRKRPLIPITLASLTQSLSISALVDSGADANVLPFSVGIQPGLRWDQQPPAGRLMGAYETKQTRIVEVGVKIGDFLAMPLIFMWIDGDRVPVILGQFDFFHEFDVCFFQSRGIFEITQRANP